MIQYYWIPEDHYLSPNGFNINKAAEEALSEFLSYISGRFQGYDVYLGFPANNRAAVQYLRAAGFECIENDYNNTALMNKFDELPQHEDMLRISRENYESFAVLHRQTEGDMYWNYHCSRRLRFYHGLSAWKRKKEKKEKPCHPFFCASLADARRLWLWA